jgi:hypothetical protein
MAKPKVPLEEFVKKLNRASQIDYARLAAYIDGEGHLGISVSPPRGRGVTPRHCMVMTVTNTSELLFQWITSTFGGKAIMANHNNRKPNTKPCWRWLVSELQAEEVVRRCLPYFIIKGEQARIALAFRDLINETRSIGKEVESSVVEARESLRRNIVALNSAKGFGIVKSGLDRPAKVS